MNSLSEVQQKAVTHRDGPMLVSGRPRFRENDGAYQTGSVSDGNLLTFHPGEILVITFTKAAAREMKERYLRLTNSAIRRFLSARFMRSFSRF